jgi:hypothetical protein
MKIAFFAAVAALTLAGTSGSYADDCSGHDHDTGTVVGAVGGAAIGGVATNSVGGAVVGGVLGGLAGNAIARSQDCNRQYGDRQGYDGRGEVRSGYSGSYQQGYRGQADENDYWGVESYDDFSADYRHISFSIQRGREEGIFSDSQARRYSYQLQQIRSRADWEQRSGRFDPQDIENRLNGLRNTMHVAREDGQGAQYSNYRR